MKFYIYRVKDKYGMIIKEGIVEEPVDIIIEDIIPNISISSDRCIWDIQQFLNKNYPKLKYTFEYKLKEIKW